MTAVIGAKNKFISGTISIPPNSSVDINDRGDYFCVDGANNISPKVQFDGGTVVNCGPRAVMHQKFERVTLINTNTSQTGQVRYRYGDQATFFVLGSVRDSETNGSMISDVSCGAGAVTQLNSGAATLSRVLVSLAAGLNAVRLGYYNITSTKGIWLNPGLAPLDLPGTVDWYVYNPNASAVSVSLMPIYKV